MKKRGSGRVRFDEEKVKSKVCILPSDNKSNVLNDLMKTVP